MYKLKNPTSNLLKCFYGEYHQFIVDGINFFLRGGSVDIALNGKANVVVKVGVSPGSPTEAFLKDILQPNRLFALMTCRPQDLLTVVGAVYRLFQPGWEVIATKRLTLGIYKKFYPGNPPLIDHFNTIMHYIFVDWVFEGKDVHGVPLFDKKKFCEDAQVEICPYCGAEDITTSKIPVANGVSVVKPDVDHFLPKSKYPYLAMTYGNLIPTSVSCNRSRKRSLDPIANPSVPSFLLQSPYLYDDTKMRFYYDFNNTKRSYGDAYKVRVWGDKHLKCGYRMMGYDSLYSSKAFLIGELYNQMAGLSQQYFDTLNAYGIPHRQTQKMTVPDLRLVLGYDINEDSARKHPYYKFRHDMAMQLIADSGCNWPWLMS